MMYDMVKGVSRSVNHKLIQKPFLRSSFMTTVSVVHDAFLSWERELLLARDSLQALVARNGVRTSYRHEKQ
jgi:hypothetical protein